ncbi:PDZ domain-containing protein [Stratiformator vulcanicus]|uniref:Serine endoprotease n=1 Tax=Stratiformator vulcanicus TaxID=2527980 RepID=A0A517R4D0_9PLAN|nr:PDZ domain-containing protein [Stratiformator vulcanicus]QDT38745.1 serine endoprotease [Stratiformator vulcanicus]
MVRSRVRSASCSWVVLLLVFGVSLVSSAAEPVEARHPLRPIERLLVELASPDFAVRVAAEQELVAHGEPAIEPLANVMDEKYPEVTARALAAMTEIAWAARDDDRWDIVDKVMTLLEDAGKTDDPLVAMMAQGRLDEQEPLDEKRMVAKVRELGAIVEMIEDKTPDANGNRQNAAQIQHVFLGHRWKGGEEGLRYIGRLAPFQTLYFTKNAKVSEQALLKLRQSRPQMTLQRRGPTKLGVSADPFAGVCRVGEVTPDSPADRAGIRSGDVITSFNGQEITTLQSLVLAIEDVIPGDKVDVMIQRGFTDVELDVTMRRWGE